VAQLEPKRKLFSTKSGELTELMNDLIFLFFSHDCFRLGTVCETAPAMEYCGLWTLLFALNWKSAEPNPNSYIVF